MLNLSILSGFSLKNRGFFFFFFSPGKAEGFTPATQDSKQDYNIKSIVLAYTQQ